MVHWIYRSHRAPERFPTIYNTQNAGFTPIEFIENTYSLYPYAERKNVNDIQKNYIDSLMLHQSQFLSSINEAKCLNLQSILPAQRMDTAFQEADALSVPSFPTSVEPSSDSFEFITQHLPYHSMWKTALQAGKTH